MMQVLLRGNFAPFFRPRGCVAGVNVLLDAGLGPILAVLVVLVVSVESRNSFLRRTESRCDGSANSR